jgi:hypothetical protein
MSPQAEKGHTSSVKVKPALAIPATAAEQRPDFIVARSVLSVAPDQRQAMIAAAAYYLALQSNFEPGHDVQDWLLAESQIDSALSSRVLPAKR